MTDSSQSPKVVVGVSGGIAAYKAADLVRLLADRKCRVQVVMTRSAREFIRPLTFAALTGEKVITGLFPESAEEASLDNAIEHVAVAQEADLLLVAPATADVLAKFAAGIADDFLTTMYLAYTGPVVVAPAMNTNMWNHPATRENLKILRGRGVNVVGPEAGELACGMVGPGRLTDIEKIALAVSEALRRRQDLAGETVLITAGPTREPVDPVRYLSNRSSGRMGFALAAEAAARGARVIVVAGPVAVGPPPACEVQRVTTAEEMRRAVLARLSEADIVIMAAAVADYRPAAFQPSKIKKESGPPRSGPPKAGPPALDLEITVDILSEIGRIKGNRLLVGFAAETENLVENAEIKLRRKNCDFIVANPVGASADGGGMDSEENRGVLLSAAGERVDFPRGTKTEMAAWVFDELLRLRPVSAMASK